MRALRLLGCVLVGLVSLAALGFVFPWLKEGYDREELPLFASVAAGLLAIAVFWWLLNRRHHRGLAAVGLALVAVPLLIYAALSARALVNDWRGRHLTRTIRIASLRETDIHWPAVEGPVGVRMEIEVEHAVGLEGNLFAPKILMGPDPRPTYRDDFFGPLDRGVDSFLTAPVFELGQPPPRDVLARPGRVRLAYDLFPSTLDRRMGEAVCLSATVMQSGFAGLASEPGSHLGAVWFFAAPGGIYVDLSGPLTDALRRLSALEGRPAPWRAMMRRLEPDALRAAGYRACEPPPPRGGLSCYCPPEAAP